MNQSDFFKKLDVFLKQFAIWGDRIPYDDAQSFILDFRPDLSCYCRDLDKLQTYLKFKYPTFSQEITERWRRIVEYADGIEGPNRVWHEISTGEHTLSPPKRHHKELSQEDVLGLIGQHAAELWHKLNDFRKTLKTEEMITAQHHDSWHNEDYTEGYPQPVPQDLITLAIVLQDFLISRTQAKRDIMDGKLNSYRKKTKGPHLVSRKEAENLYLKK